MKLVIGNENYSSWSLRASIREWEAASAAEPARLSFIDDLVPAAESPLELG